MPYSTTYVNKSTFRIKPDIFFTCVPNPVLNDKNALPLNRKKSKLGQK